jgi:hypothetical protein
MWSRFLSHTTIGVLVHHSRFLSHTKVKYRNAGPAQPKPKKTKKKKKEKKKKMERAEHRPTEVRCFLYLHLNRKCEQNDPLIYIDRVTSIMNDRQDVG